MISPDKYKNAYADLRILNLQDFLGVKASVEEVLSATRMLGNATLYLYLYIAYPLHKKYILI